MRSVMRAVADRDDEPLERWKDLRDGDTSIVWDTTVGGIPVCLLGLESHTVGRKGFVPADGPPAWTSGTLFPHSSRKTTRAINAASGNRPLVVLANLSGFDGSPESMRRRQLEFGAEIGRAVTNFDGPIVFVVVSRYHGGAFVVFSKALNESMEIAAVEGSYASVIGGAPAAATVFARDVKQRTEADHRVREVREALAGRRRARRRRGCGRRSPRSPRRCARRSWARSPTSSTRSTRSSGRCGSVRSTGSSRRANCGRTSSTRSNGAWRASSERRLASVVNNAASRPRSGAAWRCARSLLDGSSCGGSGRLGEGDREQEDPRTSPPSRHRPVAAPVTVIADQPSTCRSSCEVDVDGAGVDAEADLLHLERRLLGRPDQVGQLVVAFGRLRGDVGSAPPA